VVAAIGVLKAVAFAFGFQDVAAVREAVQSRFGEALAAGLDDTASGVVPAATRGVSPVGATPLPPTHHVDCSPTLS